MKDFYLMEKPGTAFRFQSGNLQLLGWILQRALKGETITHYLDRRIWFSLDPQFDGSWSLDKEQEGLEKTFCCLNATARDFAKLGRLYLNKGKWQQKQVIPAEWVNESLIPSTTEGASEGFKYQWWLRNKNGEQAFMTTGHLGQYIYVYPSKKLIIVRLGKGYGSINWPRLFYDYATHMD
jgi:CubicO group peptidase (beta-lactamase class C family)